MTSRAETGASDSRDAAPAGAAASVARRTYVLIVLMTIAALGMVDRLSVGIVQEPLRREFHLSDFQLGLLGGTAYALLYTVLGIPLARVAERRNRTLLVSTCAALWSGATALCGLAPSFLVMLLGRIGVSIGEAGCAPASQSIIVDYFPPHRRGSALAIYALAVSVGSIGAGLGGGAIAQAFGWRATFLVLGAIGLLMALLLATTVREPARAAAHSEGPSNFLGALAVLKTKPTFWHMTTGATLGAFVGYGVNQYFVSFVMRSHGVSLLQGGQLSALAFGLFGCFGTLLGGVVADLTEARHPKLVLQVPALGVMVASPLYMIGYTSSSLWVMTALVCVGVMINYLYVGPLYYVVHRISPLNMRNTAVAIVILLVNCIGFGLGPPAVGFLSDLMTHAELGRMHLAPGLCDGAGGALDVACTTAKGVGLRWAIVIAVAGYFWAGVHFLLAARSLVRDLDDHD